MLKTIYDYFMGYSKNDIDDMIDILLPNEKEVLFLKFGKDFDNPVKSSLYDKKSSDIFYKRVLPKIRWYLESLCKRCDFNATFKLNLNDELLSLLKGNRTANEICEILSISKNELYERIVSLNNNGFVEKRKYFVDGNISYMKNKEKYIRPAYVGRTIYTKPKNDSLKCMAISDTHIGNTLSDIRLMDNVYDYAIKNNIHIILCTGDLIDGAFSKYEKNIINPNDQASYLINNYPYDKNILTFTILGDHDLCGKYDVLDLSTLLNNYRHDIIPINYIKGIVEINNELKKAKEYIGLFHKIFYVEKKKENNIFIPFYLWGHAHRYRTKIIQNRLRVDVPSLSYLTESVPKALELTFNFENGLIVNTDVKCIDFSSKGNILKEESFEFDRTYNTVQKRVLK